MRIRSAIRWLMLAYMALVLGLVAPAHHHVPGQAVPEQAAIATPVLALDADADDPACAVCVWKGQTSLERGLPPLPGPDLLPSRAVSAAGARAPPAAAPWTTRARAPPSLVA